MDKMNQVVTENYAAYNADSMEILPKIDSQSIGFTCYSPPFPELYQYSNDPRDMSNCKNYQEGIDHYEYFVNQVYRITKPGRLTAVHCMDLKSGTYYQKDFPGDIIKLHEKAGFNFFCRITIWKDPWLIARRTRMRTLMHKQIVNDSSLSRIAGPDYLVVFRKPGVNKEPIEHPRGLQIYYGSNPPSELLFKRFKEYSGDQKKNFLSHHIWRKYASPVWDDIRSGRLLPYKEAKENEDEKHVCPLQLDVIDRCLTLWSNKGDIVLTPFMGVGSEVYESLRLGRKAIGIELKETYFNQAVRNIEEVQFDSEHFSDRYQKDLFDDDNGNMDFEEDENIECCDVE